MVELISAWRNRNLGEIGSAGFKEPSEEDEKMFGFAESAKLSREGIEPACSLVKPPLTDAEKQALVSLLERNNRNLAVN